MASRERRHSPLTFPDRLNRLFATVHAPDGDREFTNAEVAQATSISATYIGYLRKGIRDNPSVETVRALAQFFGVRPSVLIDDAPDAADTEPGTETHRRLAEALRNPAVTRLAMRAAEAELSTAALDAIIAMIDEVGKREQTTARPGRPRKPGSTAPTGSGD